MFRDQINGAGLFFAFEKHVIWTSHVYCLTLKLYQSDILNSYATSGIHRGYYTVARRYESYVRVARTILFLPLEHKIHTFELTCNVLFII